MRRRLHSRAIPRRLILIVSVWATLWSVGWTQADSWFGKSKDATTKKPEPKPIPVKAMMTTEFESVGDGAGLDGMKPIKVEGIGLVIHLAGTGSDPPPNVFRDMMMDELKKKEIYKPKELLASDSTALVLLRAFIPGGCRKGDSVDVEVYIPNGDTATSLKGGFLLETELRENMVGKTKTGATKTLQGKPWLKVAGPVLTMENPSDKGDSAALKKAKVLGGSRILTERDFRIVFPQDVRSGRRIKSVAYRINQRFFDSENGLRTGLANAKDDRVIELKLDKRYRYDIQRYLNVVRRLPLSTSETFQVRLIEELKAQLMRPTATLDAGMKLEAIGKPAATALREGLASKSELVRFSAATALAYLGDPAGIPELARLAENSPDYRAYALTALVTVDHTKARIEMARLLNASGAETRYGAFRSLWTYDPKDQLIRAEDVNGQFFLHLVPGKSEPMVHLSRNFRREVVLFDGNQRLQMPVALRSDSYGGDLNSKRQGTAILVNGSPDSDKIQLVRFKAAPRGAEQAAIDQRVTCENKLADVIRQAGKLGATYPDIVDLLKQAEKNGNLAGRLEINALPRPLPLDTLQAMAVSGEDAGGKVRGEGVLPGLFAPSEQAPKTGVLASSDEDSNPSEKKEKKEKKEPAKKPGFFDRIFGN